MNPTDLETLVDRELRRLPALRAPHTLLPRVLAAVQRWSQRPWYARAWFTWPIGGQIASAAALVLNTLIAQPARGLIGLAAVFLGTPAFYVWRARSARVAPASELRDAPTVS